MPNFEKYGFAYWIFGGPLTIVVLSYLSPSFSALAILAGGGAALVGIIKPIKKIGLNSRVVAFLSLIGFFISMLMISDRVAESNRENDVKRKAADPVAYEARVADAERKKAERQQLEDEKEVNIAAKERAEAAKKAEEKERGFHCLSAWDGSHNAFKRAVKEQLRNPKSFEHIETLVSPNVAGEHKILMKFRAENGFGGMTIGQAVGTYKNSSCDFTVIAIE